MNRIIYLFTFLPIFILLFSTKTSFAQGEGNIWYFGKNAGLDFNSGSPVALTDGAINTIEGCSSIADPMGNLLFYTDGVSVWDRNHNIMPNGTGLLGGPSSTQSALIIREPGSLTRFYIFTSAEHWPHPAIPATFGFEYSIVDMTLNSGLGDIVAGSKNTEPTPGLIVTENLSATTHHNGDDVWVTVNEEGTSNFYTYLLTSSGISAPVVTDPGAGISTFGQMKFSSAADRLVKTNWSEIFLYDFDNSSGVLSSPLILDCPPGSVYGLEFSPDGSKLYASSSTVIYQFDLSLGSLSAIQASRTAISPSVMMPFALQLGPDGKIYCAHFGQTYLSAVTSPNLPGTACGYSVAAADLGGKICKVGLPAVYIIPLPEIALFGNGHEITNTDNTPETGDFTDFGNATSCTPLTKTFEIHNTGAANLNLSGTPLVSISGDSEFIISSQPSSNSIASYSSLSFSVTYTPTTVGTNTATLTISSDDSDEGTYTFDIQATASGCGTTPSSGITPAGQIHVPPCIYAVGQSHDSIRVWWCDASENETAYEVWRKSEFDTDFYHIATVPGADTEIITFIDGLNLDADTEYTYWVVTVHHNQKSHPSDLAKDYTFPLSPEVSVTREACMNGNGELLAEGSHRSGKFRWYETETSEEFLSEEAVFETANLTEVKTYWVTSKGQKYESTPRLPITITPNALPVASIIGEAVQYSCESSISLSAEVVEGAVYRWLRFGLPVTETTEPVFETDRQGTYVLEVVNTAGCKLRSDAVEIFLNAKPEAKIFQGENPVFCESGILEAKPVSGASYEWQKDGETLGTDESFRADESGVYTLFVTQNGCTAEASTDVRVNNLGDISLTAANNVICPNSNTELTASFIADADYELLRNGRVEQRSRENTFTVGKPGTYSVRISSGTCHEMSESLEIDRIESIQTVLAQEGNMLTAKSISGNSSFASVTWFFNNEEAAEFSGQSEIRPRQDGVYRAEVIYESGCESISNSFRYFKRANVTGIEEETEESLVKIHTKLYPNPTTGRIYLQLSDNITGTVRLSLTDDLGKTLQMKTKDLNSGDRTIEFNTTNYGSGLYLIRVETESQVFIKRFVRK